MVKKNGSVVKSNFRPDMDGVSATEVKEDDIRNKTGEKMPRKKGDWVKVTPEEVAKHEAAGILHGYDPEAGEALLSK